MKVMCIKNDYFWLNCELTIGKEYEYSNEFEFIGTIYIIDDSGLGRYYPTHLFMTLDEYRNQKLEELGI